MPIKDELSIAAEDANEYSDAKMLKTIIKNTKAQMERAAEELLLFGGSKTKR